MALVKCKECGKEISEAAKVCPHCGAKPRRPIGVLGILFVVIFGVIVFQCSSPTVKPVDTRTPEQIASEKAASDADTNRVAMTAMVLKSIKAAMRDPDSLKWGDMFATENASAICVNYRARNGFGGMNAEYAVMVKGKIHTNSPVWNKHCTGKGFFDTSAAARLLK